MRYEMISICISSYHLIIIMIWIGIAIYQVIIIQLVHLGLTTLGEWYNTDISSTVWMSMRMASEMWKEGIGWDSAMWQQTFLRPTVYVYYSLLQGNRVKIASNVMSLVCETHEMWQCMCKCKLCSKHVCCGITAHNAVLDTCNCNSHWSW